MSLWSWNDQINETANRQFWYGLTSQEHTRWFWWLSKIWMMWPLNNETVVKNMIYCKQSCNWLLFHSSYYFPLSIHRCIHAIPCSEKCCGCGWSFFSGFTSFKICENMFLSMHFSMFGANRSGMERGLANTKDAWAHSDLVRIKLHHR